MSYDAWLESPYTGIERDEEDCTCDLKGTLPCCVHDPEEYAQEMKDEAELRKWEEKREDGY